jgi:hypothetical protein
LARPNFFALYQEKRAEKSCRKARFAVLLHPEKLTLILNNKEDNGWFLWYGPEAEVRC